MSSSPPPPPPRGPETPPPQPLKHQQQQPQIETVLDTSPSLSSFEENIYSKSLSSQKSSSNNAPSDEEEEDVEDDSNNKKGKAHNDDDSGQGEDKTHCTHHSVITDSDNHNNDEKQLKLKRSSSPSSQEPPKHLIEFMTGMKQDLHARLPLYKSDWKRPKSLCKVFNATFFAFVVQLIPALIFAELLDKRTHGNLAVAEVLLSAGIIGIIYAVISGQPLVLLGITGPVAILLGTSYGLAEQFDANYWSFFWWLNIWTAILHLITAVLGLVNFVWYITPFSSQIFEFFIASSFIYESIRDMCQPIELTTENLNSTERSTSYATLVIGILTFQICWTLHFAETWVYFTRQVRTILTSYNMMIALIIMTALSYLPGVDQSNSTTSSISGGGNDDGQRSLSTSGGGIERVHIRFTPWDWQPTADRSWLASPLDGIDVKGIFGALFPAFMLYLLFFIDHNISSILTQSPKYNLTKPPAYHWDFFCLGLTIIPCGLLGLPPGSGLIPQAPLHTRALCTRKHEIVHGVNREIVTHCEEQRWSALFQASLMFVALGLMEVISWIPVGCLFGVFLYLGVGAMHGNEIWERLTLMMMLPKKRPQIPVVAKTSSWRTVKIYTAIQIVCAMSIFGIAQFAEVGTLLYAADKQLAKTSHSSKSSKIRLSHVDNSPLSHQTIGYIFPALVAALVPIRIYIISRLFKESDLIHLDPVGETEDDYVEEQVEIHKAERRPSIDESEYEIGFSRFRPKDIPHDADQYYVVHPEFRTPSPGGGGDVGLRNRGLNPLPEEDCIPPLPL